MTTTTTTTTTTRFAELTANLNAKADAVFAKVREVRAIDNALNKLNLAYKITQELIQKQKIRPLNAGELVRLTNSKDAMIDCIKSINKALNPYNKDLKQKQLRLFLNEIEFFTLFRIQKIALVKIKGEKGYIKYTLDKVGVRPTLADLSEVSKKGMRQYANALNGFIADLILWQNATEEIGLSAENNKALKSLIKDSLRVKKVACSTGKLKNEGNTLVQVLCPQCKDFISKRHLARVAKVVIPQAGNYHNITLSSIGQGKKEVMLMIHHFLNGVTDIYTVQKKEKVGDKVKTITHTIR